MKVEYEETSQDLQTRINIHEQFGGRNIDSWMLELLSLTKGMKILDIGCGSGKQCLAFYDVLEGEVEITGKLVPGEENLVAVKTGHFRISELKLGGILRPVMVYAGKEPEPQMKR